MRLSWAALALLCFAALSGCGETPPRGGGSVRVGYFGSTRPPVGQVFSFNNQAEPEYLDPNLMSGQPDGRIARMIFEGLTTPDPRTLAPLPGQAERWDISTDKKTYTFHLRDGLTWTDGRPVTANDFVFAWRRALSPVSGARNAGLLYCIENAEAFNKNRDPDSAHVGVSAPDARTLVVRLTHPTPYFLFLTAYYTFLPVPEWCIAQHGDRWTRPENIVSNGPFRMTEWRQRDRIVCVKNARYWDAANVRLTRINAYAVDDLNTGTSLYKAGTIDWSPSGSVPATYVPYIRHNQDFRSALYQAVYYYSVNVTRKPFDNPDVRRALALAIDRNAIANDLLRKTRPPYGNFVPQGYPGYHSPPGIPSDADAARAALARAGYPGGRGFPPMEILFNTSEDHRRIAEAIQGMWTNTLGIKVTLSNQEWASYLKATTSLQYDVARRSWIGDYLDPTTFLAAMRTGDGNNRTGWSSREYDDLLRRAEAEPDTALRNAMLERAETILLDQAPVLPIYHYSLTELVKPYVRGLYPTVLDVHPLKYVWIDHGAGAAVARN